MRRSNLDLLETTVGGIIRPEGKLGTVPRLADTREARKAGRRAVLPPVPHSWVLLQGGTQSRDLLCQALQDRILHLSLVGTIEALERVSRVQGIHLRGRENIYKLSDFSLALAVSLQGHIYSTNVLGVRCAKQCAKRSGTERPQHDRP